MLFSKSKRAVLQQTVMGMNQRNIDLIYRYNKRKDYYLADDKIVSKTMLDDGGIPCAQTYAVVERLGMISDTLESCKKYTAMVIKPAKGKGGDGILVLRRSSIADPWTSGARVFSDAMIYQHLANILSGIFSMGGRDRALIEYCIETHSFFQSIYSTGVPDYRVIVLEHRPIMAMLRLPTHQSGGKANLHQGGLGIGIDLKSGKLTSAYDGEDYLTHHPDSGVQIVGKQLPLWKETIDLTIATSKAFPLKYLGVDIVLDETLGPLVMEVNVRPGLGIQLANRQGMHEALSTTFSNFS